MLLSDSMAAFQLSLSSLSLVQGYQEKNKFIAAQGKCAEQLMLSSPSDVLIQGDVASFRLKRTGKLCHELKMAVHMIY